MCRREDRIGVFGGHMIALSPEWEEVGGEASPNKTKRHFPTFPERGSSARLTLLKYLGGMDSMWRGLLQKAV